MRGFCLLSMPVEIYIDFSIRSKTLIKRGVEKSMSYDLLIEFEKWPENCLVLWKEECKKIGLYTHFHPEFSAPDHSGWLPLAVKISGRFKYLEPEEFQDLGKFETGFDFYGTEKGCTISFRSSDGSVAPFVCAAGR